MNVSELEQLREQVRELERRVDAVVAYLLSRDADHSADLEHIRQVLTRPEAGVGLRLS